MSYADFVAACRANNTSSIINILKEHSEYIEMMNNLRDASPIITAAKENHVEVLKILIERGGNVNALDKHGWSALVWASQKGRVEATSLLLEHGANVDAETMVEDTALIKACRFGCDAVVPLLVAHGADVNKQDRAGTCALTNACAMCSAATVQLLIDAGANVHVVSSFDISPFSAAYERGDATILSILSLASATRSSVEETSPPSVTTIESNETTEMSKECHVNRIHRADITLHPVPICYTTCSTVYRGRYRHTDIVAKVMRNHIPTRIMETEISILSTLRHPRVLMLLGVVYNVHPNEGCVALVTEYMVGGSLNDVLKNNRHALKLSQKLRIFVDVADGMRFLHSCNVLHRDLKSSNILLDHEHRAKVCDFGHSMILDSARSQVTSAATTVAYASPESFSDQKIVGLASDVYSFGVIMWEVITGQAPWGDLAFFQIANKILNGATLSLTEVSKLCPEKIVQIIKECLDASPNSRPLFSFLYDALLVLLKEQINAERTIHFPLEFMCPIGHEIMEDPVLCADGHSYERANIEQWLSRCQRSPVTGKELEVSSVVPNFALKSAIASYLEGVLVESSH